MLAGPRNGLLGSSRVRINSPLTKVIATTYLLGSALILFLFRDAMPDMVSRVVLASMAVVLFGLPVAHFFAMQPDLEKGHSARSAFQLVFVGGLTLSLVVSIMIIFVAIFAK